MKRIMTVALAAAMIGAWIVTTSAEPAMAARARASVAPKAQIGEGVQILRPFVIQAPAPGATREYELGQAALATLRVNPQELFPGWTVAFRPAKSGILGMTLVDERRVEIYVRPGRPVAGVAHDLAHELGHVTDVMYNTDETRGRYLELRNRPQTTPWWTCSGCRDMQVGAGDFAETFALWAAPKYRFYSELAPAPNAAAIDAFGTLLPSTFLPVFPTDIQPTETKPAL